MQPGLRRAPLAALAFCLMLPSACKPQAAPNAPNGSTVVALPEVEMKAAVDRGVVAPGDLFTLTVSIEHNSDIEVQVDDPGSSIAGFSIEDSGQDPPREAEGGVREVRWWRLRAQVPGSYALRSLPASYRSRSAGGSSKILRAPDVYLEVKADAAPDSLQLHDIKPLQQVHYRKRWLLIGSIAAAVLVVGGLLIGWWRRRRRRPKVVMVPLAHEVALRALRELAQPNVTDLAAVRRYYFAISEVLRAYVEARFRLNATDLTTEEILARLPTLVELQSDEQARLREFLGDTDRVKFAGYAPVAAEITQSYERALRFVESTQIVVTPPPSPPSGST